MSNLKVKIKDYEPQTHNLLTAIRLTGLQCNYITADLLYSIVTELSNKDKEFSVKDAARISVEHEDKWDNYFNNQKETNEINTN